MASTTITKTFPTPGKVILLADITSGQVNIYLKSSSGNYVLTDSFATPGAWEIILPTETKVEITGTATVDLL